MNSQWMMCVRRYNRYNEGVSIRVCVEPHHPRFMVSMADRLKSELTEEDRFRLCNLLSPHFGNALERNSEDPILVKVGEDTYKLHRCNRNPKKVRMDFV